MITKIVKPKTETIQSGKIQETEFPKGYIKVTGYTNRAMRRAYLKSLKKGKV